MDSGTAGIVATWIGLALISYALARQKGKNEVVALGTTLLFGMFATLYYIFTKGSKEYQLKKAKEKVAELS